MGIPDYPPPKYAERDVVDPKGSPGKRVAKNPFASDDDPRDQLNTEFWRYLKARYPRHDMS